MSDRKRRHKHKRYNGKSFIILPIIFLLGTYLVLYLAFMPTVTTIANAGGLIFANYEKDFSNEYKNIFVPVSENSTQPTVTRDEVDDNGNTVTKEYIDSSSIEFPGYGNQFGELIIEDCGINNKLFYGDDDVALRNGVGIYTGSHLPGYGSTILVAGHNNTYFNGLKNAEEGQIVTIRTSYGNYTYKINHTAVKKATDTTAYDLSANRENLIMYTCYPFDELGLTERRFFVYADYVSGPQVDTSVQEGD